MFCKVAWNELGDDEALESTMARILGCCEDCDNQVATAWGSNASTKAFTLFESGAIVSNSHGQIQHRGAKYIDCTDVPESETEEGEAVEVVKMLTERQSKVVA
ncbi:hypothetical protein KXD40_001279 [Peronospora effusa]|nr:hypothetical protein KXD40_001279 [Peronospora effusa]